MPPGLGSGAKEATMPAAIGWTVVMIELVALIAYQYRSIGPGSPIMRDARRRERDRTDLRSCTAMTIPPTSATVRGLPRDRGVAYPGKRAGKGREPRRRASALGTDDNYCHILDGPNTLCGQPLTPPPDRTHAPPPTPCPAGHPSCVKCMELLR